MSTAYSEAFGSRRSGEARTNRSAAPRTSEANEEFEKSEFWLNVGDFEVLGAVDENDQPKATFVSLKRGIPLDGIKPFDASKAPTENMAVLRQSQNWLLEDVMAAAQALAPGESRIINLKVELKRVKGNVAVDTTRERVRREL